MILLGHDCLLFQMPDGGSVPLDAKRIVVEVSGDLPGGLDQSFVAEAVQAVFFYFRHDLDRTTVSFAEFAEAMEKVLRQLSKAFGCSLAPQEWEADLSQIALESAGVELAFFTRVRRELQGGLNNSPTVVRLRGLRQCVKHITGRRRWGACCRELNQQIVSYLRACLQSDARQAPVTVFIE